MKILFVGNFDPAEVHTSKWASYFESRHEVKKLHFNGFSWSNVAEVAAVAQVWKPDILHSHYAGSWGLIGYLAGYRPFVVTVHGSEVLVTKGAKKLLVKKILREADLVTTDGKHVAKKLADEWDIENVSIIQFGVDCNKFRSFPLYRVFDVCYRTGPDPVYNEETIKKALSLAGVKGKALTGYSNDMMPEVLNASKIYISAARSDAGLSMTTAEAMACGLPVLLSDFAENVEWVGWEWCFKPDDYDTLANRIKFLLNDEKQRDLLGERNRAKILELDNFAVEMAKMEKLYEEVIEKWKQKRKGKPTK